jgi:hypothetical protein
LECQTVVWHTARDFSRRRAAFHTARALQNKRRYAKLSLSTLLNLMAVTRYMGTLFDYPQIRKTSKISKIDNPPLWCNILILLGYHRCIVMFIYERGNSRA